MQPSRSTQELLAEYLVDRDASCPRCGYNLRNCTSAHCPECGDAIQLGVQLVEPRMGTYIAILVATSLGFGGSGMVNLLALTAGAPDSWWWSFTGLLLIAMTILFTPAFVGALRFRRTIRRWSHRAQATAATVAWFVLIAMTAVFIIFFDD